MIPEHPMIACVERAVQFIQNELQEDRAPTLDNVAIASGMSKFHFHRIYKLISGETCRETITRLRMAKGAALLEEFGTSITEAALAAGYASSQAFAKAIKRELSTSASALRSDPERLSNTVRTLLEPSQTITKQEFPPMRIEICSLDPLEVVLVRTKDKFPDLAETYWKLVEAAGEPQNISGILGLPHRDISTFEDDDFIFDCAIISSRAVECFLPNMKHDSIAPGTYLLVRHKGLDIDLPHTLDALYAVVLTQPDIQLADAPCVHHYIDDPEEVDEIECRTDIYMKIDMLEERNIR